jgi:hypothetical protein
MVELRVGSPNMGKVYLKNKKVIKIFPVGVEDLPIPKLICLYTVRKIILERTMILPLRGELVSRSSHGKLLSERERERETKEKKSKREVPRAPLSNGLLLFYIKGFYLLSKLHLGHTRVKHVNL